MPFCVTVDPTTDEDGTVTIRERDSCEQVRLTGGIARASHPTPQPSPLQTPQHTLRGEQQLCR